MRPLFNLYKKQTVKNLIEKKDAQLKEYQDEIDKEIYKINLAKESAQSDLKNIQEEYKINTQKLEDDYSEKELKLKKNFDLKEQSYHDLEIENAKKREIENSEKIAREQQLLNKRINDLKDDYANQENDLKQDFLAYSEQISLQKENLDKEIQEYQDKQLKIVARFKEDEKIRNERDFYKIKINEAAAQDIQKLKVLATSFHNTNAIYKLIWEVYYKTPMEALFKKVLGLNEGKGGIYKITDITNEKVYIGRTTDFKTRFRTHAKRGCGIDRINGLLYDAMMEKGLENFTFEIVEVCNKEEQAQKEKYWIGYYHSNEYGYNIVSGG